MREVLITQRSQSSLERVNESINVDKTLNPTSKLMKLGGIFTEFDVLNENQRIYTAKEFLPHLEKMMERKVKYNRPIYGEFDHPADFETSLKYSSHIIDDANFNENNNNIMGSIRILNTHWGKEAQNLVNDGMPLFVSSRAAGVTESNGYVKIKKLFTYDLVADPGFASARMNCINESLGFKNDSLIKIYDLTSQEKTNQLFQMNKNDMLTKDMLHEYSTYVKEQIELIKEEVAEALKGNTGMDVKEIENLLERYDNLNNNQSRIIEYLDYMAENIKILKSENESLKKTQDKLISHSNHIAENVNMVIDYNNYLGEKLDQSINYQNYISENLNKSIVYSEYLGETVDKSINYQNYLSETLDKSIQYSQYVADTVEESIQYQNYLAENLDKNISYGNYLAENLDKNISYSQYLAENLDKNISYGNYLAEGIESAIKYGEYLAENLDSSIAYSEYLAESVESNIKYSEYLAENLDSSIAYSEYLAESVENNIKYSEYLAENLDSSIEFSDYLSENLNNNIEYSNYLAEGIEENINNDEIIVNALQEKMGFKFNHSTKGNKLFESYLKKSGYVKENMDDNVGILPGVTNSANSKMLGTQDADNVDYTSDVHNQLKYNADQEIEIQTKAFKAGDIVKVSGSDKVGTILNLDGIVAKVQIAESDEIIPITCDQLVKLEDSEGNVYNEMNENVAKIVEEVKKRRASSEPGTPGFLEFLTKEQKVEFLCLTDEQKEEITSILNEKDYYTTSDIVKTIKDIITGENTTKSNSLLERFSFKRLF